MYRLLFILMLFIAGPVFAQTDIHQSKWDVYLDHAYELSYWEEAELLSWLDKTEREIGQSLVEFSDAWHKKITEASGGDGTVKADRERFSFPEEIYRRLAVADFLLYLKSKEKSRLDEAIRVIDVLKSKLAKPEIAFWNYFIRAHNALSDNDAGIEMTSKHVARNIFRIWLDVILPLEEAHEMLNIPGMPHSVQEFSFSLPYLYENVADLILRKAIIQHELPNLEALGVIIRAFNERMVLENGYAEKVETIVSRMSGPKSDIDNFNFTVTFLEAEEYRFEAQMKLNEEGLSASSEEAFQKSRHYYMLAYTWANTQQGKTAVISDYLDLVSFTFSRLSEKDTLLNSSFFTTVSGDQEVLTTEKAIHLFEELAKPDIREYAWRTNGFAERTDYITAMHSLWNSIVELSLWSAYYHEKGISSQDIVNYSDRVLSYQAQLRLYLDFFERNLNNGYVDVIPENAYFNAAEAAAKSSSLYHKLAPYSTGMNDDYRAFARLLQYVELFPYNPEAIIELAQRLNKMGTPGLYVQYVLPIAERVKDSQTFQMWKNQNSSEPLIASLDRLQKAMPEIIVKANTLIYLQGKGTGIVREDIKLKLKDVQEESKTFLNGREINLEADTLSEIKDNLDQLIQQVSSNDTVEGSTIQKHFIDEIIQLKGEIQKLEETNYIIAELPEYIELSKKIRKDLAQTIDHPVHSLLRQFFHESSLDNKYFYQVLKTISES